MLEQAADVGYFLVLREELLLKQAHFFLRHEFALWNLTHVFYVGDQSVAVKLAHLFFELG